MKRGQARRWRVGNEGRAAGMSREHAGAPRRS